MNFDWKFVVLTLVSIAGVLAPLWIWQADLVAHSLSVQLTSSFALQPKVTTSIPDLQISIDGVNIKSPFLSTLQLSNDGSRPILTSDFESPIEFSVGHDTRIVRARVSSVAPNDLKAELDTNSQAVGLRPLLLNPNDTLTIEVITSGGTPKFVTRARIAGISKVKFEDVASKKEHWTRFVTYLVSLLVSVFLYFLYGAAYIRPTAVRHNRALSLATMFVCAMYSAVSLRLSFEAVGLNLKLLNVWNVSFVALFLGFAITTNILRMSRR